MISFLVLEEKQIKIEHMEFAFCRHYQYMLIFLERKNNDIIIVNLLPLSSQASHIHKSGHRAIAQRPNNWPFIEISRDDASLH